MNTYSVTGIKRPDMIQTIGTGGDYGHSIPPVKEIKDACLYSRVRDVTEVSGN